MSHERPLTATTQIDPELQEPEALRKFCEAWVAPLDDLRHWILFSLILIFNLVCVVFEVTIHDKTHLVPAALGLHALSFPIGIYGLIVRRKKESGFVEATRLLTLLSVVYVAATLIYATRTWPGHDDVLIMTVFQMTNCTMLVHFLRLKIVESLVFAIVNCSVMAVAFAPMPLGFIPTLISSVWIAASTLLARINQENEWRIAATEYRFRRQIVPEHILQKSASATTDFMELFRPLQKWTVCLSTSWQHGPKLAEEIPASQLTASLSAYHQWCQNTMRTHFPEGNYYGDWLADQLFFVAYSSDQNGGKDLINRMLSFALELLEYRLEFARIYGIPDAIDIGLAAGPALVGVMGPKSHPKATALGAAPDMARRLESVGRSLRRNLGDTDRIIMLRDVLMLINQPLDIKSFVVTQDDPLKTRSDYEVFYVDSPSMKPGANIVSA